MIHVLRLTLWAFCAAASAANAHDGVQNPAVKARMHAMMVISASTRTLGQMANGRTTYDPAAAHTAANAMAAEAARISALFAARENDPKSEARPAIWQNFPDFSAKADALHTAAIQAQSAGSVEELAAAMGQIGATCRACHGAYRE